MHDLIDERGDVREILSHSHGHYSNHTGAHDDALTHAMGVSRHHATATELYCDLRQ